MLDSGQTSLYPTCPRKQASSPRTTLESFRMRLRSQQMDISPGKLADLITQENGEARLLALKMRVVEWQLQARKACVDGPESPMDDHLLVPLRLLETRGCENFQTSNVAPHRSLLVVLLLCVNRYMKWHLQCRNRVTIPLIHKTPHKVTYCNHSCLLPTFVNSLLQSNTLPMTPRLTPHNRLSSLRIIRKPDEPRFTDCDATILPTPRPSYVLPGRRDC